MPRTVTIHAVTNDLVGDETFEAWLKHETDPWTLVDAGDVEQVTGTQDFVFPGLIDGADYSLQIRMRRAGRYRIGYLSADPDSWPAGSRIDFTVGSLIDIGAPILDDVDDWERTSAVETKFVVHITPDDINTDLELYDNGALIHTFTAPLAATIAYDVLNPTAGINHAFRARHIAGTLGGPFSAIITKYAGPGPVIGLEQLSSPSPFGRYDLAWTDDSRTYRVEHDYLCSGVFVFVANDSDGSVGWVVPDPFPVGVTQRLVTFSARVRAEVVTFGVTDVSAWAYQEITIEDNMDDEGSSYNTCP